jgi:hypothetical protein
MRIQVAFINKSTVVTDATLTPIVSALQKQVDAHFRPTWGVAAAIVQVPKGGEVPLDHAWIGVFDDSDQAGALGYHDLTPQGFPVGKVFAKTDQEYGASLSVTCSHELLEMLGDPYINLTAIDPVDQRLYAVEASDAVEADELGYTIEGIQVSDFVLPQYFDPQRAGRGEKLSFRGHVTEPFSLAPGGYASYVDLRDVSAGWQQVDAATAGVPGQRPVGFPPGSRRIRRARAWENDLQFSEPA